MCPQLAPGAFRRGKGEEWKEMEKGGEGGCREKEGNQSFNPFFFEAQF